ncbi:putative Protein F12F1.11 [Melia azedarach]|uniref:Uncharacterized protein n=1 Tax=Melia azedarach TaxID=155640 RepID=A0ACC1X1D3_MELAZ|nr:putative Protein F12F1.11 [Melia azedarach]
MKKLYRKGTVHPSPPVISDHLSFLPATILTLTAALSPEDREVLAYLISCSNNNISVNNFHRKNSQQKNVSFPKSKRTCGGNNNSDHPPLFTCDCFRCYMSYWVRWDSSPNRQLIHEIIDAFEDELLQQKNKKMKNNKKDKKRRGGNDNNSGELKRENNNNNNNNQLSPGKESAESESAEENSVSRRDEDDQHENCKEGEEKSSVRSFVSFIGERIWGVWG